MSLCLWEMTHAVIVVLYYIQLGLSLLSSNHTNSWGYLSLLCKQNRVAFAQEPSTTFLYMLTSLS